MDPVHSLGEVGGKARVSGEDLISHSDGGDVHRGGEWDHIGDQPGLRAVVGSPHCGELGIGDAYNHLNVGPHECLEDGCVCVIDPDLGYEIVRQQLHYLRGQRKVVPIVSVDHSDGSICASGRNEDTIQQSRLSVRSRERERRISH